MIRIGTTDDSPEVVAPTIYNVRVCASQDSPVANGATQELYCGGTGRYLVVLLEKTEYLTLCEVEAFEGNTLHTVKWDEEINLNDIFAIFGCSTT